MERSPARRSPHNDGFALDFYFNSKWQTGRELTDQEMQSIGAVFTPESAPVINGLAEQYAVFTHWHCDVPTCTFPNRTFFHAGTSKGRVDNNITWDYAWDNDLPNLFTRASELGVDWRAYFDPSQVVPFESINLGGLHHRRLWKSHSHHIDQFFADAAAGQLPRYSWVEPCMLYGDLQDYRPPTDIRSGEAFLASIYNAVRSSPQWEETALVVMFDEHGGTFNHVPPPQTVSPDGIVDQEGFTFDRLGIRVPAIVVSAYTERGTVIPDLHTNTSMTRTLRESLGLGRAFSRRDEWAAPIDSAFNLSKPRQDRWEPSPLPYVAGKTNPGFQPIRAGDEPTPHMALEQRKQLGIKYVSELGEATLGAATALLGLHPEDAPLKGDASHVRRWLTDRLTKDGQVDIPEST